MIIRLQVTHLLVTVSFTIKLNYLLEIYCGIHLLSTVDSQKDSYISYMMHHFVSGETEALRWLHWSWSQGQPIKIFIKC